MSNELESFVRPFQSNDITPSQTYYNFGQIGQPNVILRLGRGGGGKTLTGSFSNTLTVYLGAFEVERDDGGSEGGGGDGRGGGGRNTHITRIAGTNADGDIIPDVWADVERIDKLHARTQNWGSAQSTSSLDTPNHYQEVGVYLKWRDDPKKTG